jgi:phosphatidylserine/phosphatidylglycerophosphate/cardiolipin synthase-like enzyme
VSDPLLSLAPSDLRALASAIGTGRLTPPYSGEALKRYVSRDTADHIASSLQTMHRLSESAPAVAHSLELLALASARCTPASDLFDLVTTSPEVNGQTDRDTSVVVGDLFRNARESVLVAGYAVYQGQKVFQALANRMEEVPTLAVRMYLDVQRKPADTTCDSELVRRFVHQFRAAQWPAGKHLPEIYYYPASLTQGQRTGAALHAKCIVVDGQSVYISSANFTEAAQQRNIEVGILVHSFDLADRVIRFFNGLVSAHELIPAVPVSTRSTES